MFKKILTEMNKPMNFTISLLVVLVLFLLIVEKREHFAKSTRYMYLYNGIPRNSSYDIRAEPEYIPMDIEKTGPLYQSSLYDNETNQRVRPYYKGLVQDIPKDSKQYNTMYIENGKSTYFDS